MMKRSAGSRWCLGSAEARKAIESVIGRTVRPRLAQTSGNQTEGYQLAKRALVAYFKSRDGADKSTGWGTAAQGFDHLVRHGRRGLTEPEKRAGIKKNHRQPRLPKPLHPTEP